MNHPHRVIPKSSLSKWISEGKTTTEISKLTGISSPCVLANADRYGLKRPNRPMPRCMVLTDSQLKEAARRYHEERHSTYRLARDFKVHQSVMQRALRRIGEVLRSPDKDYRKYRLNETYFDIIDTDEKAYWLGFLYADGGLSNYRGNGVTTYSVRLGLIATDDGILVRMRDTLYPDKDKPIGYPKGRGGYPNGQSQAYMEVHSKHMIKALIDKGCGLRKSLTLRFPTSDQVPDHLARHFVRGYFDGDGCITWNRKKWRVQATFSLLSSLSFVKRFAKILKGHGIYVGLSQTKHSPQIWRASVSKQSSLLFLHDYIYRGTSLYLPRKKVLFDQLVSMIHERSTLDHSK